VIGLDNLIGKREILPDENINVGVWSLCHSRSLSGSKVKSRFFNLATGVQSCAKDWRKKSVPFICLSHGFTKKSSPQILISLGKLNTRNGNDRTAAAAATPPIVSPRKLRLDKFMSSLYLSSLDVIKNGSRGTQCEES